MHSSKEKLLSQAKTTLHAIDSLGYAPKQLASLKGNFLMGCRSRNISGTQTDAISLQTFVSPGNQAGELHWVP